MAEEQKTIGELIKESRLKAGFTQEELAKKMDSSKSLLCQYEKGIRRPKYSTLLRIANALNVSVFSLMDFEQAPEGMADNFSANRIQYGAHFYDLMRWFTALNEAGQLEAVKRLSELAELPRYQKSDEQKEGAEHGEA